ncbi:MAG: hypothetical protein ACTTKK_02670 [Ottowia sp.]
MLPDGYAATCSGISCGQPALRPSEDLQAADRPRPRFRPTANL